MLAQQQLADAEERDDVTHRVTKTHLLQSVYSANTGNNNNNNNVAQMERDNIDK